MSLPDREKENRCQFNELCAFLKAEFSELSFVFEFFPASMSELELPPWARSRWKSEDDHFCLRAEKGDKWICIAHTFINGSPNHHEIATQIKEYHSCST